VGFWRARNSIQNASIIFIRSLRVRVVDEWQTGSQSQFSILAARHPIVWAKSRWQLQSRPRVEQRAWRLIFAFQAKKVLFQVVESLKVVNKRWWHHVKQEVPCCCKRCPKSEKPHFFQWSYLDQRLKVGKTQVECMVTPFEAVEIKAVLAGVMETEEVNARLRSNPAFAKRFRMEDFKALMSKNKLEDALQIFDSERFIYNDYNNMIIQFKRQFN
jgi:hypothetical protein